jgi:hypothetical protein
LHNWSGVHRERHSPYESFQRRLLANEVSKAVISLAQVAHRSSKFFVVFLITGNFTWIKRQQRALKNSRQEVSATAKICGL